MSGLLKTWNSLVRVDEVFIELACFILPNLCHQLSHILIHQRLSLAQRRNGTRVSTFTASRQIAKIAKTQYGLPSLRPVLQPLPRCLGESIPIVQDRLPLRVRSAS